MNYAYENTYEELETVEINDETSRQEREQMINDAIKRSEFVRIKFDKEILFENENSQSRKTIAFSVPTTPSESPISTSGSVISVGGSVVSIAGNVASVDSSLGSTKSESLVKNSTYRGSTSISSRVSISNRKNKVFTFSDGL